MGKKKKKNKNMISYDQFADVQNMEHDDIVHQKTTDRWTPIRRRGVYRDMKVVLNDALDEYWNAVSEKVVVWAQHYNACEKVTLKAYRLLKYIRKELGGINACVDDKLIGETQEAAITFYNLHEDSRTSFQEESNALEILSRAAYREMKQLQKLKAELEQRISA